MRRFAFGAICVLSFAAALVAVRYSFVYTCESSECDDTQIRAEWARACGQLEEQNQGLRFRANPGAHNFEVEK